MPRQKQKKDQAGRRLPANEQSTSQMKKKKRHKEKATRHWNFLARFKRSKTTGSYEKKPKKAKKPLINWGEFFRYVNQPILITSLILLVIGVVMVLTASSYIVINSGGHNVAQFALKQGLFVMVGMAPVFFLYPIKTSVFRHRQLLRGAVIVLVLLLLIARFLFAPVNGAHGWIIVGPISIQPMEFVKPIIVLLWADYYACYTRDIQRRGFFKTLWAHPMVPMMTLLFFALTMIMPDFGGLLILGSIWVMMSLASGVDPKNTVKIIAAVVALYFVMVAVLSVFDLSHLNNLSYVVRRFTAFVNPFADERGTGLQLANSYYALGRGGIIGVGAGNSIQKMGYLPEAHNDFIMAIVGEEFGLMGILLILALYYFLTLYLFNKALKVRTTYHQLILIGVASYFLIQSLVNLGAVTGMLPITGVTFPFISYGGSSVLTTCVMLGIVLAALRTDYKQRERYQLEALPKTKSV
ncbi:MAG: FtsW/RodA/SpoVE family cell cycle protein [Aerococcus sp.]|nr:FtsW/RodA/SpoVE family cell cycle protein [Aerococcus sp.]